MWSILLQAVIVTTASYAGNQIQVQRLLALKNLKLSKRACLLSIPMLVSIQLLCCFCGLIFYVYFQLCDPVTSNEHPIESYDQILPYYIIYTMRDYPGLPGLCIAGIFSAALSTVSSAVNTMAVVTYEDIIQTLWPNIKKPVLCTKIGSVFYGTLTIIITFVVASMGNLIKSSILVVGMVYGPSLGVFLLASLTTTANQTGTNIGLIVGFLLAGYLTFIPNQKNYPHLPVQHNCSEDNITAKNDSLPISETVIPGNLTNPLLSQLTTSSMHEDSDSSMSFMWITPLSLVLCIVTGYVVSWLNNYIQGAAKPVYSDLLSPIRQRTFVKNTHIEEISMKEKFLENTS